MLTLPSSSETFIMSGNARGGDRLFLCLWVHVFFPLWMSHGVQVSVDGLIVSEHFTVKNDAAVTKLRALDCLLYIGRYAYFRNELKS
jgi:hypothetical protein